MHKHKSTSGTVRKMRRRSPNYLPTHVAEAFQKDLAHLIDELGSTGGFKENYLKDQYLSKYMDPTGVSPDSRRSAAIHKWMASERTNDVTNQRLYLGDEDFGWATSEQLLTVAAARIRSVLGPLVYPGILFSGTHSKGASTRISRSPSGMVEKYTGKAHVSSSAVKHWLQYASNSMLSDQVLTVQDNSVLFTVPKATDIDRVACKEPEINMFLQKSIGSHIRKGLRRKGINLNDQSINQELARTAVSRDLATIDLSAASDSITTMLVMRLLPYDWFSLLDDLRVKTVDVEGEIHTVEMFSSMGNGFTFELESLIFWALAHAIKYFSRVPGLVSVYGDDIVVPTAIAPRLARTFSWFGFRVNSQKSSWTGQFRESCGGHYYGTMDVTPFYIREPVRFKTDVIRLLNRLAYWDSREIGFITDPSILPFHKKWSNIIPQSLWGGQNFDDVTSLVTGHRPRKRIALRKGKRIPGFELGRYLCWFTNRELTDLPLAFIPLEVGKYVISSQPEWLVDTTFKPWLLDPV